MRTKAGRHQSETDFNSLVNNYLYQGLDFWICTGINGIYMKPLYKMIIRFLQREWFLFVILTAISLIFMLFELL